METRDHVIIGSGFGGSIPALRLAEAGSDVLVLERGKRRDRHDFKHSWSINYLAQIYTAMMDSAFEMTFRYGNTLGGGSVVFSGAMIRPPSEVFTYKDRNGYKIWPDAITRQTLDPYLARVEGEMQIRQARWDEVPMPGAVFAMLFDNMGLTCDRISFPYVNCIQCGYCEAACRFDRKRSLILNYIPKAEGLGAEFRCESEARTIAPHPNGYKVTYRSSGGVVREVVGRRVLIAANAIESAALLLRSREKLPGLSSQVGKNFHNNGDFAWFFELPEGTFPPFRPYKGRNNAAVMSYAFWEREKISLHTGSVPPGVFAGTEISRNDDSVLSRPWGLAHKHWAKKLYTNGLFLGVIAVGLTDGEGTVTVNSSGMPQIALPITPTMQLYHDRLLNVANEIAVANDARVLRSSKQGYERGGAHLLGTCRMGDDPGLSVTDLNGQLHGFADLYCTDSSTIPGSAGVNPSLTVAANAERLAENLVKTL